MAVLPTSGDTPLSREYLAPPPKAEKDLGEQDFLMLIVEQMRNQNPLNPTSDTDFIAQIAQFDTLSQMRKMNEALVVIQGLSELTQASGLIGRTVTGIAEDGTQVTGKVDRVKMMSGVPMLDVGGKTLDIYMVQEVR